MRVLRGIGLAVLYLLAGVGVLSGVAWAANAVGLLQPLIVVSGSMSPGIRTGDLIFSVPKSIADVGVGDVLTLQSPLTQRLVTHRVVAITQDSADGYRVTLKGDANDEPDSRDYLVSANQSPPSPWFVVPGAGRIVETVSRPGVAIPLVIALAAVVGLTALPPRATGREESDSDLEDPPAPGPADAPDLAAVGAGTTR
ncbi:hypothetical protein ASF62_08815 [Leifsonia sp. Leaf325]|nr:signal peptidase I [Leifsonia sp. Leaf325]KQQ94229.1 hypothetical protein ASF62_08815 [Leifsonia sp. Leaf325]